MPKIQIGEVVRITNTSRSDLNGSLARVTSEIDFINFQQTVTLLESSKHLKLRPHSISSTADILSSVSLFQNIHMKFANSMSADDALYENPVWIPLLPFLDSSKEPLTCALVKCYRIALLAVQALPQNLPHHKLLLAALYEAVGCPFEAWVILRRLYDETSDKKDSSLDIILSSFLSRERNRNLHAFNGRFNPFIPCISKIVQKCFRVTPEARFYIETLPDIIILPDYVGKELMTNCNINVLEMWLESFSHRDDFKPSEKPGFYGLISRLTSTVGEMLEHDGKFIEAIPCYEKCINTIDTVHKAINLKDYAKIQSTNYQNKALAMKRARQFNLAEIEYVKAINLSPNGNCIHNYCTMQLQRVCEISSEINSKGYRNIMDIRETDKTNLKQLRVLFSKIKAVLRQQKKILKSNRANVRETITDLTRCDYHLDLAKLHAQKGELLKAIQEAKQMRDIAPTSERRRISEKYIRDWKKELKEKSNTIYFADVMGEEACLRCGALEDDNIILKTCGRCKSVTYCSAECQKLDFKDHKKVCVKMNKRKLKKQEPLISRDMHTGENFVVRKDGLGFKICEPIN